MKIVDAILSSKPFKASLRIKVVIVFIMPMILALSVLSYLHNTGEQRVMEEQIESTTIQLGDMALSGLKHAMLRNDRQVIARILNNIGSNPAIKQMWLIDPDFRIVESTNPSDIGKLVQTEKAGCVECHKYPPANRPRVTRLRISEDVLRVVSPIANDPECQACHSADNIHLGVLVIDAPLVKIREHMRDDQIYNIVFSLLSIVMVAGLAYMLIQWLIVQRVEVLYKSLYAFAAGDFSVRVPKRWRTEDEITRLADHFNDIADVLQRHQKEQNEIAIVREEAIAEERERIAHELHDGIAQLLAYLTAKVSATRLLLSKDRTTAADEQLSEMEEAVQKQATEVRTAIIGLKLVGQSGSGLIKNLKDYVVMCNRLNNLNVVLEAGSDVEALHIDPETELQLLRIAQESISNIRKHAAATEAKIIIKLEGRELLMEIQDNGIGFDPWQSSLWRPPHFGLRTMGERAEKIKAVFRVYSAPGQGVRVSVRVKLEEG